MSNYAYVVLSNAQTYAVAGNLDEALMTAFMRSPPLGRPDRFMIYQFALPEKATWAAVMVYPDGTIMAPEGTTKKEVGPVVLSADEVSSLSRAAAYFRPVVMRVESLLGETATKRVNH